ncbi:hypothetical protein [Candidatus Magnetominusculus xianensis]|uniref:Secreted protein n=1 Tax=Candidatus Magnetominusculus xianensis TaxID=1748249 RepID=A0ABR5SH74_9BACT|nr:hypothetical protein [Candidatus Magnetominusculus xianensis]KWT91017.1 hypothetical protein ASN18_0964 [Candidatus Magnetominusculus xianensis]MBF0402590.1 hypothetical protein [Nitrospirota bacterium]
MSLCLRLVVLLVVSSVMLSPQAGLAEQYKDKFYIISLKDSYSQKKYKVRAFYLDPGLNIDIYSIPKMPINWRYDYNYEHSSTLIAAAYTDREAVDIGYFKEFLTLILMPDHPDEELYFSMTLICYKPDGTPKVLVLNAEDFFIREIHKSLKKY